MDCWLLQPTITTQSLWGWCHHQNYKERHLRTIFNSTRTSLLHFVLCCSQHAHEYILPFVMNTMPTRDMLILPIKHLSSTAFINDHHLQCAHIFGGCPVFILGPYLKDSKKISKWSMRSKCGVYLGVSPFFSSTVHIVLNPLTGSITPQYDLVFDDTF